MSRGVATPTAAPAGGAMPAGFFDAYTGAVLTDEDYGDAASTAKWEGQIRMIISQALIT
jgi:hypothetical protein